MSKHNHNYSQYSNKKRDNNDHKKTEDVIKTESVKSIPEVKLVQETVETVTLPETVEGMVVNCARLNVRENATVDSGIVCVLNCMSEIRVDVNRTTNDWAYIHTATGLEGYCMRQYIEARL